MLVALHDSFWRRRRHSLDVSALNVVFFLRGLTNYFANYGHVVCAISIKLM